MLLGEPVLLNELQVIRNARRECYFGDVSTFYIKMLSIEVPACLALPTGMLAEGYPHVMIPFITC